MGALIAEDLLLLLLDDGAWAAKAVKDAVAAAQAAMTAAVMASTAAATTAGS
jgi:hypothetical protein